MADKHFGTRYTEKSEVGSLSEENIVWFWEDRVEIFQNFNVAELERKSNVCFDKSTAVRYARMILDKYEVK